jgi:hypothetical protein
MRIMYQDALSKTFCGYEHTKAIIIIIICQKRMEFSPSLWIFSNQILRRCETQQKKRLEPQVMCGEEKETRKNIKFFKNFTFFSVRFDVGVFTFDKEKIFILVFFSSFSFRLIQTSFTFLSIREAETNTKYFFFIYQNQCLLNRKELQQNTLHRAKSRDDEKRRKKMPSAFFTRFSTVAVLNIINEMKCKIKIKFMGEHSNGFRTGTARFELTEKLE